MKSEQFTAQDLVNLGFEKIFEEGHTNEMYFQYVKNPDDYFNSEYLCSDSMDEVDGMYFNHFHVYLNNSGDKLTQSQVLNFIQNGTI